MTPASNGESASSSQALSHSTRSTAPTALLNAKQSGETPSSKGRRRRGSLLWSSSGRPMKPIMKLWGIAEMRDRLRTALDRSVTWNSFAVLSLCAMLMFLGLRMREEYRADQVAEQAQIAAVSRTAIEAAKSAAYNRGILDARTPLFNALTVELHRTRTEGTVADARIYAILLRVERLLSAERARSTSPSGATER